MRGEMPATNPQPLSATHGKRGIAIGVSCMSWDHELSRHERGYGYEWTKRRAHVLQRDNYLCQPCLQVGRVTEAREVDHVIPKALDGTDDYDNLQSICTPCHKDKTKAEGAGRRRNMTGHDGWPVEDTVKRWGYSIPDGVKPSAIPVVLVCGPPASGKTTHAHAHAGPSDTIIDMDAYKVTAGGRLWDTRSSIWRKAFTMRDRAIRSLAHANQGTCYLIVTASTKLERDAWCEALGDVTIELISTPEAECIRRIKADPERQDAANSQIEAVKHWWLHN
jgi:hypothetical protein